jgi:hypothetical protein
VAFRDSASAALGPEEEDMEKPVRKLWPGRALRSILRVPLFLNGIFLAAVLCGSGSGVTPALGGNGRLQALRIDGSFDPDSNLLNATAKLSFIGPAGMQQLWLANELQLHWVRGGAMTVLPFTSETGLFAVQCPPGNELELSYSGRLPSRPDPFAADTPRGKAVIDDCRFLSYIADYYPHPQLDFASMEMSMRIPSGWNCLGSGTLRSVQPEADGNIYSFSNPQAKGMSLVCGRFRPLGQVAAVVPLRLHGWDGFDYRRYYSDAEMARLLSFYSEHFGPLGVPELNILFRRGKNFGGISYSGLIVLNIDESWDRLQPRTRPDPQCGSLLALDDVWSDLLSHEVSHQWWGGLVSWETAADHWITEGLATYSSLLYLKERRGEKAFARVRRRFHDDVKRYAGRGVTVDGGKLKLLHRDIQVYQALVYMKPALMFAALADTIGEAELCRRLRDFLTECRCRNVGTIELLSRLSAGDEELRLQLEAWICERGLPKGL